MTPETAQEIMKEISDFYTAEAGMFAITREKVWVDGPFLVGLLPTTGRILDVGCGSGRFAPLLPITVTYTGIDMSQGIITLAHQQYLAENRQFLAGSMVELPFSDAKFDAGAMLASLHHVPSQELRKKAVSEVFRVLKSGSIMVATVWNMRHEYWMRKFKLSETDFDGSDDLDPGDVMIPWKAQNKEILRYVHAFLPSELEELFKKSGFVDVKVYGLKNGEFVPPENGLNLLILGKKL